MRPACINVVSEGGLEPTGHGVHGHAREYVEKHSDLPVRRSRRQRRYTGIHPDTSPPVSRQVSQRSS